MAVAPTGDIYKALSFDNVSSRTYGVYITGSAVYNAPEREVEMISIPGRNGQFALDKGRFENIEVTYPAGIFADSETDFADAISELRNFLCSRKGYVRLQDEYNPNEYRMAIYKSGLEVEPAQLKAGEFEITFDCKPQRFLTSGETAVTVSSGDTLTNPTLFEAAPLLEIEGYGTLNVNGTEIELDDDLVGDVDVSVQSNINTFPFNITFPNVYINVGDEIELYGPAINLQYGRKNTAYIITDAVLNSWSGDTPSAPTVNYSTDSVVTRAQFSNPLKFYYGTPSEKSVTWTIRITQAGITSTSPAILFRISYDGNKTISVDASAKDMSGYLVRSLYAGIGLNNIITIHSTATTYGHPTYIDCDIGEAYAVDDDVISSLNSYITLGSQLPILSVGESEITFDNTITDLKVIPRWWKV